MALGSVLGLSAPASIFGRAVEAGNTGLFCEARYPEKGKKLEEHEPVLHGARSRDRHCEASGWRLGHKDEALIDGISALTNKAEKAPLPFLSHEDIMRRQPSATWKGALTRI